MALEPPQPGCSTEELRVWVIQAAKGVGVDLSNFELGVAGQINVMTQSLDELDKASVALKKDVSGFPAMKHLVTDAQLEARTEAINADLKSLKAGA